LKNPQIFVRNRCDYYRRASLLDAEHPIYIGLCDRFQHIEMADDVDGEIAGHVPNLPMRLWAQR